MPSHSDVGPLLSLNLRPSGNPSSGSVAPARRADSSASSFQHWLTSPQGNAAKDVGRAKTQASLSSTQGRTPNQVQSALLKEKGTGPPVSGNESESDSGLWDELPISASSSLGLAETAEALALPLDVELKGSIEDDLRLEQGLQELIQWLEEGGLEALDSEPGQEQLYALLTQMGLTPAPEQLPHLAMQIRAALSESGSSPKALMASLKTLLSPSGNNGSVQIAAPASGGLEIEPGITRALNDTADFGLTMKAASKIEIGRGGAEATPPRGETPMVHTALGAEASARDTPLQPSERQFVIQPEVRVPVGQPQWGRAVGERILWLANQNITSAELRLDPPELGPVQVRVAIQNDQVNVTFTSNQQAVREALDLSAQRLREMFSEQGLDLVDVNVSDQSEGQAFGEQQREGRGGHSQGEEEVVDVQPQRLSLHLVDSYV